MTFVPYVIHNGYVGFDVDLTTNRPNPYRFQGNEVPPSNPAREDPAMARTPQIPTTLTEYQQHVRKEALKVQIDMGWPDDKMNQTLIALGLPPKVVHMVPMKVTATATILVPIDDQLTEEDAKASVANLDEDGVKAALSKASFSFGHFATLAAEPGQLPSLNDAKVGDADMTLANGTVYRATPAGSRTQCEDYNDSTGYYCTRQRGHEGQHVGGSGTIIRAVWAQNPDSDD